MKGGNYWSIWRPPHYDCEYDGKCALKLGPCRSYTHGASVTCSFSAKMGKTCRMRALWMWTSRLPCSSSESRRTKTLWSLIPKEECSGASLCHKRLVTLRYLLRYHRNTMRPSLIKHVELQLNLISLQGSLIASHGVSTVRMLQDLPRRKVLHISHANPNPIDKCVKIRGLGRVLD